MICQSGNLSLSSVLKSDYIELDFKEISYLVLTVSGKSGYFLPWIDRMEIRIVVLSIPL